MIPFLNAQRISAMMPDEHMVTLFTRTSGDTFTSETWLAQRLPRNQTMLDSSLVIDNINRTTWRLFLQGQSNNPKPGGYLTDDASINWTIVTDGVKERMGQNIFDCECVQQQ